MKKLLILFFLVFSMLSCSRRESTDYATNYTYKWKLAVTYTNGDQDTINCQYDSFNENKCYLFLRTQVGSEPCIIMGCGFYWEAVVCGVRKYEILSLNKEPLFKNN